MRKEDLNKYIGMRFGDWIVLDIGEEKTFKWRDYICKRRTLKCKCECGKCNGIIKDIDIGNLKQGKTTGCGRKRNKREVNEYKIMQNYVIGLTKKGEEFYFDLEDYDKVVKYSWYINQGYARTKLSSGELIYLHNLITNKKNPNAYIDHINRNKCDNRKSNLRECSQIENSRNVGLPKNNKSGIIGVGYDKNNKKWIARIVVNYKDIHLGRFLNKEDAIKARLQAELKYFGIEFAPQKHLFKEYGIEVII